ncbi:MAG: hypothetical protein JO124_19205 [Hyphomicrobiales bacterium]|nr:hypothetical protein [Hyphomicrobiales bacterium]
MNAAHLMANRWSRRLAAAVPLLALCLLPQGLACAAPPAAGAEADAALIEACLGDPSMRGRDPHECGDRVLQACGATGSGGGAASAVLSCEKRREEAWNVIARQTYHALESRLDDAGRHLLRASQAQFELDLRDLCALARVLVASDAELAAASCASDLVASRALSLRRLAKPDAAAH